MEKFFKIILLFTIVIIFLAAINIYAATNSKGHACALISSERGAFSWEGDTSMNKAKEAYDTRGYETVISKDLRPISVYAEAKLSQVQLYFCHGSATLIQFPKGGICIGPHRTIGEYDFYSIDNLNWSDKKLVTFAACNTAGNGTPQDYSLAAKVVEYGAQMSVGWYTEVNAYSFPDWLDNYHAKLKDGSKPLDAIIYANSKNYMNSNVKNVKFSSSGLSSPLSESELSSVTVSSESLNNINENVNILDYFGKESASISEIENIIKEKNMYFEEDNYEKNFTKGLYTYNAQTKKLKKEYSYIDYNLKIGDFISNSGYKCSFR